MRSYLDEMTRLARDRGLALPKAVRVNPDLEDINPMKRVGDTLQINPRHPALSASGIARDVANAQGGLAGTHTTASAYHLVRHEMVHFSHTGKPTLPDVLEFAALEDFRRVYGDRIGLGYAFSQTDSAKLCREFVAEIGAGLLEGRTYDDTVMDWYRRLGGPAL